MYSLFFSNPARGTLHKREKEGDELRPKTLYTHIQLHIYIYICVYIYIYIYIYTTYIYNVYGRNTTPSFSLLWSVPRARFEKKSEYIFLRHREAAGWIRFINLNQAAGRTKFCGGPDLARGPDFGHACFMYSPLQLCHSEGY